MKTLFLAALLTGAMISVGCNPVKSTAEADAAAAKFQALFNAEEYEQIFNTSHADFQASQPKEESINFLRAIREKLGPVKSSQRTGWKMKSLNLKTSVVLTFETEFKHGQGLQTFTYRMKDGNALLLGWHVDSKALIMGPTI